MFDIFTDELRLVMQSARLTALQCHNEYVEPEHLLLDLVRDNKNLFNFFLEKDAKLLAKRKLAWLPLYEEVGKLVRNLAQSSKTSENVVIPLAAGSKSLLARAAEISEELGHSHIGVEHLLIAMFEAPGTPEFVRVLNTHGITGTMVRKQFPKKSVLAKDVW